MTKVPKKQGKSKKCADCPTLIDSRAEHCKPCAQKKKAATAQNRALEDQAIDLHSVGTPVAEILARTGRGKTWFYGLLRRKNIDHNNGKTYPLDETVLDEDSHFKFYILGLFASDGHVGINRNSKYVDISLHRRDKGILEDLQQVFKTAKPLHVDRDQLRLTLYSEKLFDLLQSWGIGPRKSLSLKIAQEIPLCYMVDFLRGIFDGDGSITGKADITLCATASELFAYQVQHFYGLLGYETNKYRTGKRMWTIKKCGRPGLEILAKLYRPGGLYLPRKYERFLAFVRPTLDEIMMETAFLFSNRSTCGRLKVGCVLTDENRNNIISVGYNGGVAGLENHCESSLTGACGCIHAEPGALIKGRGPLLYCTHLPCPQCAKLIINAGVKQVYYSERYRNDYSLTLFSQAGVRTHMLQREKYQWKLEQLKTKDEFVWR